MYCMTFRVCLGQDAASESTASRLPGFRRASSADRQCVQTGSWPMDTCRFGLTSAPLLWPRLTSSKLLLRADLRPAW
ncbi:Uncharacterized protein HZ326_4977 [Fusarium oxysporum f. sp. albedinis]|nr:Uncharacterized protein HZ326_4977 [Fusarium oxysporum f. sp. albedinis]